MLLLSTKCNKSFKVLFILKKSTKLLNRMLCTVTENRTITPWTHPCKPLFTLLRYQPALQGTSAVTPQTGLPIPTENSTCALQLNSTLQFKPPTPLSTRSLWLHLKKIACSSIRGRQLNSKAGSKGRKIKIRLMGSHTKPAGYCHREGRGRNKGFILCAAHFRHVIKLSSLAHQSQSLPECTPGYFYLFI